MYRKAFLFASLAVAVLLVAGCPRPNPSQFDFTSADTSARSGWNTLYDAAPAGLDLEGAGGTTDTALREVVEPDVIRQDGKLLYVLNQYRGLMVVDLSTNTIRSRVATQGFPRDLYVSGGRAYVLVSNAASYTVGGDTVSTSIHSRVYVVDVSDANDLSVLDQIDLQGDFVDSRLVGHVLYAVCSEYNWMVQPGGAVAKQQGSQSWVTSINVADPANIYAADSLEFDGYSTVIDATPQAVFVAAPNAGGTAITYVDISDPDGALALRGSAAVKGTVADRYKFDLWNGVLRVVSSVFDQHRRVYVTTFDMSDPDAPQQLGETHLDDALNETLFATRFDGARAYIVTYLSVDPLFIVDLSNPAQPVVAGSLEVPGWSTHIEPRGDMLIALGVDDTDGRKVSVSTYNVADPAAPALIDRVSFGSDWTWSNAYEDVKAFTLLSDTLIVPFSGWTGDQGGYDRLQFVSMDPAGLLEARDYVDLRGTVQRSFAYNGKYYGVTTEQLATISGPDLGHLDVTKDLTLAEYVADQVTLSPLLSAQIITNTSADAVVLRTIGTLGSIASPLGEVAVDLGSFESAYVRGNTVVLVGTEWADAARYRVAWVDCSSPLHPSVSKLLIVDVPPYWGNWWWGPYPIDAVASAPAQSKFFVGDFWYPWDTSPRTYVLGDQLVLRCRADKYDSVFGDGSPLQGLAVVDLAQMSWKSTIGLGFANITAIDAAGSKLYLTTRQAVGYDAVHPLCAYFLRELEVATPAIGPAVNVPGQFVQYDPASEVLLLRDNQWDGNALASSLETAHWDGANPAEAIDTLAIPDGTVNVMGRGAKVFMDSYDAGYYLYTASVASDGAMALSAGVLVSDGWGWLLDAQNNSAYVAMDGGLVARYTFKNGGHLGEVTSLMGTPIRLRFTDTKALAIGGYFGVVPLPLE